MRNFRSHWSVVNGVAVTADGRHAISACDDHTLREWNIQTGKKRAHLSGARGRGPRRGRDVGRPAAISASADQTLRVWDLETGQTVRSSEGTLVVSMPWR